jgi:hypothetical protein
LLATIDIANDQTMIGTNKEDYIFVKNGFNDIWHLMPGRLSQVSTGGRDKFVGVNSAQ